MPGERKRNGFVWDCSTTLGTLLWLINECAGSAFFWTINCLPICAVCTWPTHSWSKGCILKPVEYHRCISLTTGDLYGKPGTKTSETCQPVTKGLPLDRHQLLSLCCPICCLSWISPLPAATPPRYQWDRWEHTASPLLLQQSTCVWSVGPPGREANRGNATGDVNGGFPFYPCFPATESQAALEYTH